MTATQRIRFYAVALTALVVLFAIGAILGPRRTQSLGLVFPGLEETGVQRVEISSGTVSVTLLQAAQSWVIDEGERQYPARADRIQSFVSEMAASRLVRRITGNESLWPDFGVTDEAGTLLKLKSATVLWGSPASEPGLSYLRLGAAPDVYASDGELGFYLRQPVSYWSYLRVFPEDVGLSEVIALSSSADADLGEGERLSVAYALERAGANDGWVFRSPAGTSVDAEPLSSDAVVRLIREVVDLVGVDFSRDGGVAPLPVVGSIEMVLSDGREFGVELLQSAIGFVCRASGPGLPGDPFGGVLYELTPAKVRRLFPALSELAVE